MLAIKNKKKAATSAASTPVPKGTIVQDISKNKWRLGEMIGKGGFGEIYTAKLEESRSSTFPYIIKMEPHSNGPLFVEINFYMRNAKTTDIASFKKSKGIKTLGLPEYRGSGSFSSSSGKFRFLVMEQFGIDLSKLHLAHNGVFPAETVFKLAIQILYVLEYIHSKGYVHCDIKPANLLLGNTDDAAQTQVYLVDFGLVRKCFNGEEFKPNPKQAHDGTIEFSSRDAHNGIYTKRGDLEALAYNIIQLLGCKLPWEVNLKSTKVVQKSKEESMSLPSTMLNLCFGSKYYPKPIETYLEYLHNLAFNGEPDYDKARSIFSSFIRENGGSLNSELVFSVELPANSSKEKGRKGTRLTKKESDQKLEKNAVPKKASSSKQGTKEKMVIKTNSRKKLEDEVNINTEPKEQNSQVKSKGPTQKIPVNSIDDLDIQLNGHSDPEMKVTMNGHGIDKNDRNVLRRKHAEKVHLTSRKTNLSKRKSLSFQDFDSVKKKSSSKQRTKEKMVTKTNSRKKPEDEVNINTEPKEQNSQVKSKGPTQKIPVNSIDDLDIQLNGHSDSEMEVTMNGHGIEKNDRNVTRRKHAAKVHLTPKKTNLSKRKSLSFQDFGSIKKRLRNNQKVNYHIEEKLLYNAEMKAIAARIKSRKAKPKTEKTNIPQPSTSKGKAVKRKVVPLTHGEVIDFEASSSSE